MGIGGCVEVFSVYLVSNLSSGKSREQQKAYTTLAKMCVVSVAVFPLTFLVMRENAESQFDSFPRLL